MENPVDETLTIQEITNTERPFVQVVSDFLLQPLLNKMTEFLPGKQFYYVATVIVVAYGTMKLRTYIKKQNRREKWNAVGKNVVVLHTVKRARSAPSASPFALKLETYLRMAKIPYEVDMTEPWGPKGKCPWITLNGDSIADSQLIIETLGKKFDKNFSSHLTAEEIGIARAMRVMMEEHFFWCFVAWMFVEDDFVSFRKAVNFSPGFSTFFSILVPLLKGRLRKTLHAVGIGRHTRKEIEDMAKKDIAALSTWLGNKQYFMGDEPTEVDCTMFGFLAQFVWHFPNSPCGITVTTECSNLINYCYRMKDKFWPDWNENLDPPRTDMSFLPK